MATKVYFALDTAGDGKAASRRAMTAAWAELGIPADAELAKTVLGKPYLKGYPSVQFNLSHSGGYGVCAVSDAAVGVDVELIRPLKQDIARRFFTSTEQGYLASRPTEEFFHLWTRKESFTKALGKGLTLPLDSFSVLDDILYRDNIAWFFHAYPIDDGYLTVCCQHTEAEFYSLASEDKL